MKTSENGKNIIKQVEALKLSPYLCSAGVPTIGFGSTQYENGTVVKLSDPKITEARAHTLFDITLKKYEDCVNKVITKPMTQNQFDAFVMMCYNCGIGAFAKPCMVAKYFNEGNLPLVKEWWIKSFVTTNGKPCNGLVNRRAIELNHFNKG